MSEEAEAKTVEAKTEAQTAYFKTVFGTSTPERDRVEAALEKAHEMAYVRRLADDYFEYYRDTDDTRFYRDYEDLLTAFIAGDDRSETAWHSRSDTAGAWLGQAKGGSGDNAQRRL